MKARLLPLDGKYYRTRIIITDNLGVDREITICGTGSWEPSDRELEGICSIEQWRNNDVLECAKSDFYPDGKIRARDAYEIADSHFESREVHQLAMDIIDKINA